MHVTALAILHGPIFFLALTLAAYAAGCSLQRWSGRYPVLNPTLLAIAIVSAVLLLLRTDYRSYFSAMQPIHLFLGPAVIALAVPLYMHFALIRERAVSLAIALIAGSLSATISSLVNVLGSAPAAGPLIACVYVVGPIAIWFGPETKGRPLADA